MKLIVFFIPLLSIGCSVNKTIDLVNSEYYRAQNAHSKAEAKSLTFNDDYQSELESKQKEMNKLRELINEKKKYEN